MKTKITFAFIAMVALVYTCATNPFTGKKTMALVSNDQLFPMAFAQYSQFLNENRVVKGSAEATMVTRVGQNIAAAAERYLTAKGHADYLKGYKWEYNLVDDKNINAWCMPGGKIVVYTGILPVAKNEAGLAAIMGHEVAHALANHGQQRMSAGYLQQGLNLAGNIAIKDEKTRSAFNQYYGVGTQVGVMLPFSRSHETEADEIGIYLMAIAGYDPYQAPEIWKRMTAVAGGSAQPEILSTHPSNESRISHLTALAPKAVTEAKRFGVTKFRQ